MNGEAGVFKLMRGPLAAAALLGAIGWLVVEIWPLIRTEERLRRAEAQLGTNAVKSLQTLVKTDSPGEISCRQRERGVTIAREALARIQGDQPLLRRIGRVFFDQSDPGRIYPTANREMMLSFELPPNLGALKPKITVVSAGGAELCEVRISDDGATGRGDVPLAAGEVVVADVYLVCPVGAYGPVATPIALDVQLEHKSRGPTLRLKAGDQSRELQGVSEPLQVERGTPLRVELADELGLQDLEWSIDGVNHSPFDWSKAAKETTRVADLPRDLTSRPANARTIVLRAKNSIGLPTRAMVDLLVREPDASAVQQARLEKRVLEDGATIHAAEKAQTLVVKVAPGEFPHQLGVTWVDQQQKLHASGQEMSALLTAEKEGPHPLAVLFAGTPVLRCTIEVDWTPPSVCAVLDPGRFARDLEVRRALHEAPTGSIATFTIADAVGLDRELVEWAVSPGLEEIVDPDAAASEGARLKSVTRRFRCAEAGEVRVRLSGSDLAGNRTTIHEYRIRVADPMEDRVVTVNGVPFPGTKPIHLGTPQLAVRTEGGIEVDGLGFVVLDPANKNAVVEQVVLQAVEQSAARAGTLDLGASDAPRRLIGVLSRDERELVKGEIVLDLTPPRFQVKLDPAGGNHDVPRFFGEPGQRISLSVTDDVGVDLTSIAVFGGASIDQVVTRDADIGVYLILPAVLEEAIVVEAADEAGNGADLRFEIVVPEKSGGGAPAESVPAPRSPASRPTPDGGPPPPEPVAWADLSSNPRISHASLGNFLLVRSAPDAAASGFYIGENELALKQWRPFVAHLRQRGARGGKLGEAAAQLLSRNEHVWKKNEDEPFAGITQELVRAYVEWANEVGREHGVWKVPTLSQWKLAAGRGTHPQAVYPTTANFPSGGDLNDEGVGGALFGRDFLAVRRAPPPPMQPGAFGLRAMAGSVYEWVVDPSGRLRLTGGSVVSGKDACRLDAPPRAGSELAEYEPGFRLVVLPRRR